MARAVSRVLIRSVSTYRVGDYEDLDRNKVARYRRALRRGDTFPPIVVIKHRIGLYEIFDGFHRFHAHRLEGRKTIQIAVAVG
jgi:ParB-like chromosome segregation protein Spo0J